jgi:hypothetical protein
VRSERLRPFYPPKLNISDLVIRYQPSAITKRSSLNGNETREGGSIIIPNESKILDITDQ